VENVCQLKHKPLSATTDSPRHSVRIKRRVTRWIDFEMTRSKNIQRHRSLTIESCTKVVPAAANHLTTDSPVKLLEDSHLTTDSSVKLIEKSHLTTHVMHCMRIFDSLHAEKTAVKYKLNVSMQSNYSLI